MHLKFTQIPNTIENLIALLSCKLAIFVEEKPDIETKKSKFYFATCKNKLLECDEWRAPWLFYVGGPYHIILSL